MPSYPRAILLNVTLKGYTPGSSSAISIFSADTLLPIVKVALKARAGKREPTCDSKKATQLSAETCSSRTLYWYHQGQTASISTCGLEIQSAVSRIVVLPRKVPQASRRGKRLVCPVGVQVVHCTIESRPVFQLLFVPKYTRVSFRPLRSITQGIPRKKLHTLLPSHVACPRQWPLCLQ